MVELVDEIHGVRKEKERLTAASISGFLSLPFTMNQMSVVPSLEEVVAKEFSVDLFQDRNVSYDDSIAARDTADQDDGFLAMAVSLSLLLPLAAAAMVPAAERISLSFQRLQTISSSIDS